MNIFGLKRSSLRPKILRNRAVSEDLREKNSSRLNKIFFLLNEDINEFIKSLPSEQTHYDRNKSSLHLFKQNFNINTLSYFLNDLQLANEKILAISREKLLDIQKLIEFIPETSSEFYQTLYSLDSAPKSKT